MEAISYQKYSYNKARCDQIKTKVKHSDSFMSNGLNNIIGSDWKTY
ncbi:protein of unknown function [Petrocella atlantisensis]|uniref:Uncharacterized protein n=1 Tax=Petrocella atlantisensis TaxID=2173034 RepID=A0A3P7NZ96_9FIRM|nr:protein of unknown function [Petrocella atlantisensis]